MTMLRRAGSGIVATAIVLGWMAGGLPGSAAADGPFSAMGGNWSGSGQMRFDGGNAEALKCRAYYTPKDAGASVGLAIRCASPSNKIELRATLTSAGGRVSGNWEERTFNAMGDVSGQATNTRLNLSIKGGGFSGSMTVGTTGSSQSVLIQTEGTGLRSVNINLSRS